MTLAFDAVKWIADTLLARHHDSVQHREAQWIKVAEYVEGVAQTIDSTADGLTRGELPHAAYAQLEVLSAGFPKVLWQIYDPKSINDNDTVETLDRRLRRALHQVEEGDFVVENSLAIAADAPNSKPGREIIDELRASAGTFRATSAVLKATS